MTSTPQTPLGTPFDDLDDYLALARLSGLVLSPDGSRLVISQAVLDADETKYVSALWEIDPAGDRSARRITWGVEGEGGAAFTSTGDLLFTASRPVPGAADDAPNGLWRLPADGGEASRVACRGGGISGVRAARSAPRVVVSTSALAATVEDDERIRGERKDKKVKAILHTGYPVRHWDHDLGPDVPHLLAGTTDVDGEISLDDLTPTPGIALREADYDLAPDGSFVVSTWSLPGVLGSMRTVLVRIDAATGERTTIVDDDGADLSRPVISPDASSVVYLRESYGDAEQAPRITLHRFDFEDARVVDLASGWDRWPTSAVWLPDSAGVLLTADERGRGPVFVLRGDGTPAPLTTDDAAYSDLQVAPDGSAVYALRASYARPPHPVRIALAGADAGTVTELRAPSEPPRLPGRLTEVVGQADDGTPLRAWLALPESASADAPAPLVLWVHGGPLNSWNTWSWRWNPWLLVAKGYAVLLPDPALSTGYGQDFVQRGWGQWGKAPFTDLMAITDAAVALPEIDAKRTAAMGGSFGGYMANWIAGHTDRFQAIVTHASLWALDQFAPTTDAAWYWAREMTPEMAFENSPHLAVADIVTPMLVIHGDKDYRVPIGEGLRLWYELLSESGLPADAEGKTDHRFLYFPDENHWVLSPQHAKVWYQVVESFLAEHVLEEDVPLPDVLG
ncbi:S9 family peptidase [Prescottella equi]|uniref:Serine peptidase n=1 Tax=Rhodococcus hoagii (strain 103S) TaxID=685727 RepID=A0A3S5Y8V2_RHOH1|nr:alpha/beta fold hydrolase [Prescottella equi]MBM4469330.1 prolyl oligopeptidase family serine peptidase [Prescottella equi]MBM4475989.1 prolyl oligopeptidase family serine peptidase [Prescottella equi]MBM4485312.1 prolyl oligopeptidase family serine peptidase [Prescottella equi]MDP8014033.1 prolyl oligopeptidase family serine peptidase [Prescottella equi]NKS74901.1 prolyl oligopeptidase family serine peptidase [Prescottella equi]